MDRRVTRPKRVNSLTWGPPPPWKQALNFVSTIFSWKVKVLSTLFVMRSVWQAKESLRNSTAFQMIMIQYCLTPYISHWSCFLSSVALRKEMIDIDWNFKNLGQLFQVWMLCPTNYQKIINSASWLRFKHEHFVWAVRWWLKPAWHKPL